jgi:hypothetical protein
MRPFHCAYAFSKVASLCCVSLLALYHAAFHAECIDARVGSHGSILRSTLVSLMVAAAFALVANAAFLFRPRPRRAWTHAASVSSRFGKWKPTWFMIVSVTKLILRAVVISNVHNGYTRTTQCALSVVDEKQFHAATFMWDCAVLLAGASAIFCDLDADFSPALRRCDNSILALCLCLDTISSYIWGNDMAGQVALTLGQFQFLLENQITSCITSQVVIALHFTYTSWRSRAGRGWAYESLRFELDECGKESVLKLRVTRHLTLALYDARAIATESEVGPDASQSADASSGCMFCHLRRRLLQYQQDRSPSAACSWSLASNAKRVLPSRGRFLT